MVQEGPGGLWLQTVSKEIPESKLEGLLRGEV
jgi:hypothetical protein